MENIDKQWSFDSRIKTELRNTILSFKVTALDAREAINWSGLLVHDFIKEVADLEKLPTLTSLHAKISLIQFHVVFTSKLYLKL